MFHTIDFRILIFRIKRSHFRIHGFLDTVVEQTFIDVSVNKLQLAERVLRYKAESVLLAQRLICFLEFL